MKRLGIVGLLVIGALATTAATASADWRVAFGVSQDRGARGTGPAFRHGYDRGWREGSEEGYSDGRHRRDPRFWREGEFRAADRGYKGWMGPRWEYASGFRQGYEAGYRRAFAAARPGWHDRGYDRDRSRYDDSRRYGYENDHREALGDEGGMGGQGPPISRRGQTKPQAYPQASPREAG